MVGKRVKKTRVVIFIALAAIILIAGAIFFTKKLHQSTPLKTSGVSQPVMAAKDTTTETDVTELHATPKPTTTDVDPTTLTSVAIEPMNITVFYSKGTPGFEFSVLKTADQTQYVRFTSSDLVGTKCTDDQGEFASIVKNPSSNEAQITSQTIKVGNDTYGLSLASAGCTSNTNLLTNYQTGFKNGFSRLAAL